MRFPRPLVRGRLVRRYKRFLADVVLDEGGGTVTAHCANSGSMMGVCAPGSVVWVEPARNPKSRLPWSWQMIEADGTLVGISTMHPNRLAEEAIAAGRIAPLAGYGTITREVRYGTASRVDLLLTDDGRPPCFVEVKNVHLRRGTRAEFPDSVTARGTKHLHELAREVAGGARAVMLFVIQRADCDRFALAADIDPAYAAAFAAVRAAGVEAFAYACRVAPDAIEIERPLPLDL